MEEEEEEEEEDDDDDDDDEFLINAYNPWSRLVILLQIIQKILLRHPIKYTNGVSTRPSG
jgi:hypothetical protein